MPLKDGSLTKRETDFVDRYVATGSRAQAEKEAGYVPGGGRHVLYRPEIQARIVAEQQARVVMEGVPLAIDTLLQAMRAEKAPWSARITAAKIIMDKGLPTEDGARGKELHEMTPEEIAQAIANLEGMAATMAKPIPEGDVFG